MRAAWRVCLPLFVGFVFYLAGQIAVPVGLRPFATGVSGRGAVMWALVLFSLLAAAIGASGLIALAVASRLDGRPYSSYGLDLSRRWGVEFFVGVLIGVLASIAAVLYQAGRGFGTLHPEVTGTGAGSVVLGGLVVIILLAFYLANNVFEEILFRAILIQDAAEGLRSRSIGNGPAIAAAVALSAPVFGALHLLGGGGLPDVLTSLLAGILFASAYVLTGQLSLPIGVHLGGVSILTFIQEPVSQNPELTLPSLVTVEGIGGGSLVDAMELWGVRAAVGILLVCAWVYYTRGEIAIAEGVYT